MKHLSENQIKLLLSGATKDVDPINTLRHFESCAICRAKMPVLGKAELFDLIQKEPTFNKPVNQKKTADSPFFWRFGVWRVGLASVFLLVFGVFSIWFFNQKSEPQLVLTPTNINASSPTTNFPAENTNREIIAPENFDSNQNSTLAAKKDEIPVKTPNKSVSPPPAKNTLPEKIEIAENSLDRKELARNLKKNPAPLIGLASPNINVRTNNTTSSSFAGQYPIAEVISETQPVFKWNAVKNARSYELIIYDENYNPVFSQEVSGTSRKIEKSLKRGEKYLWQVKANVNDAENSKPISSPASFRVAKVETIGKINKLKTGNSRRLERANLLFSEGLLSEAEKVVSEILRKNRRDKLAAKFLQRIKSLRQKFQNPPTETKPAQ